MHLHSKRQAALATFEGNVYHSLNTFTAGLEAKLSKNVLFV